jgi:hypothetical protein
MARVNGPGVLAVVVGGALGGFVVAAAAGFVINELEENRRRKWEQAQAQALQAKRHVLGAVRAVSGVLGWTPICVFDQGCPNAWWDGQQICVSTPWAINSLLASCTHGTCAWTRTVFLVAHEMGHAMDPDRGQGNFWRDEIVADTTAGFVVGQLGLDPKDVTDELQFWQASATHPDGRRRVAAFLDGYRQATGVELVLLAA